MEDKHPQNKFSHLIKVRQEDIDVMGHVNNVVYLRWVQEVATAHWEYAAPENIKSLYLWVVLRHEIDYHRPAFLNDDIQGLTWVGTHQGAKFERFVSLYRAGSDQLLASAKTTWCLLDAVTMRPKRIEQDVLSIL
ncbi:acyl-CoA thioesterase [Adhaeribacter radiodurans]|uniref:Acyl-CoA thioesterase n=1 Tax=Adhaeribacter radiodurans TaxID=2745197 RepID=A0A7L7LAA1_9BACT|nr:thioesterase family protein [Adhaeribacter radiodurans]QMU29475.1 acyl-CoA thioesterase [Adhaeribacter radiodurans]